MLNVDTLLQTGSIITIALIIFAETGLLLGFFLPGDTLLIAAGLLAASHKLTVSLWIFLPIIAAAAIAGYEFGYAIGYRAGPRFFKRRDGILFRAEYIDRTQQFFLRHGGKTILLARFVAIIRTVIPLVAGVGKMDRRKYTTYNIIGGILWTFSVTIAAYYIGKSIPNLDKYILYLLALAVIVTILSVVAQLLRNPAMRRELSAGLKEELRYFFKRS